MTGTMAATCTRILHLLATTLLFSAPSTAHGILESPNLYDWGFYGLYPKTRFKSYELAAPRLNFLKWDEQCDDGYYLVSPRGSTVNSPAPVILDGRGNLVWTTEGSTFGKGRGVTDFKVQMYKGKPHLTLWGGVDGVHHRYGAGCYFILDETYQVVKTVEAVETRGQGLRGDLHEFHITEENTGLMTIYYPQPLDLSPIGGPVDGWVLDSIFQEIDLETGQLIFEWRASEHIPIDMTMRSYIGSDLGLYPVNGFDYVHINSVDKDHQGNYIISNRHTHTVMCISPAGETLWILGGKHNQFEDLSDGRATDFTWQHHARWHRTSRLSLFDNAKSTNGGERHIGDHSRGMMLELDTEAMTATLLHDYYDPAHPKLSESQGSTQVLNDTGNVVVDYGFLPALTEFSPEGDVLCDIRIAPWLIWQTGMVTSYRGFKTTRWVGRPWYAPAVSLDPGEGVLYVSWNGATEVDSWVLQGAGWAGVQRDEYVDLKVQKKDGFEAGFEMVGEYPRYVRVAALDRDGVVLKTSDVLDRYVGNAAASPGLLYRFLVAVGAMLGVVLVAALIFRERLRSAWTQRFPGESVISVVCGVVQAVRKRSGVWRGGGRDGLIYDELKSYEE
ncbi:hypothetical protein KVR01_000550 [Diaporthe batatas]|uniref:uncharacterized protein n=1 Tax=Diaporthe batatas TaxID=748121 RepID=UPI001D04D3DE|nr:uncharacterized protein KVR01_000550 [Diaporthe batatas]KAG8169805.1 hypothetical protein KVR01_000550 [Diaporthe batatas]